MSPHLPHGWIFDVLKKLNFFKLFSPEEKQLSDFHEKWFFGSIVLTLFLRKTPLNISPKGPYLKMTTVYDHVHIKCLSGVRGRGQNSMEAVFLLLRPSRKRP